MTQLYNLTVPYEEFVPYVTQYIPDVSEFVAVAAIRNACIEFCEKTLFWQYNVPAIPAVASQASYVVQTPNDTKMVTMVSAYFNTNLLIPQGPDELSRIYRMGDWQQVEGTPQYITRIIKPEVRLVPTPSDAGLGTLYLRVALAPTRDSGEIDSEIFEQWAETISWGARARIYAQTRQDYTDKNAAIEAAKMFKYDINRARMQVAKGLTRSSPQVEFQRFV